MLYDDEGYVLITLRNFAAEGGLYRDLYSQYGPFFYLAYDALHRLLDFSWTHTSGRWLTLINWLGTAGLCAAIVARGRAPFTLVLFTLVGVFTMLWINVREPIHPGSFTSLLVAAAALAGAVLLGRNHLKVFAVTVGVIATALALVKINLGVFVFLATLAWLALAAPSRRPGAAVIPVAGVGLLLPFVLMSGLLEQGWVFTFALISGISIVGAVAGSAASIRSKPAPWTSILWLAGSAACCSALVVLAMGIRGTSPADLIEGVLLGPLRHPGAFAFAFQWMPGTAIFAATAVAGIISLQLRPPTVAVVRATAWIRVIISLLFLLTFLPAFGLSPASAVLNFGLPLAGLFAWPLASTRGARSPADMARAWLALLLVFQGMHAFPVAGSQVNWGAFLWLPLMILGLNDSFAALQREGRFLIPDLPRKLAQTTAAGLMVVMGWNLARPAVVDPHRGELLALPGAERLRLPGVLASAIQITTVNARLHADVLFTIPGCYSFNLWSGVPTPTRANATHWFSLLSVQQQEAIIARLDAADRPLLIVQNQILVSLTEDGFTLHGPLFNHLHATFERAFTVYGYAIWVRKGRTIAPLQTARLFAAENGQMITVTLAPLDHPIAGISLKDFDQNIVYTLDTTDVRVEKIFWDNRPDSPPEPVTWPLHADQPLRLHVRFPSLPPETLSHEMEVLLLDAEGRTVSSARVLPVEAFGPLTR